VAVDRTDPDAMSLAVLNRCRGKRSITLDLKRPGAARVFADLVRHADIVVENFSSGTADRLGVGYAVARAANPAVIYCSISGFGAHASSGVRAMDTIIQALRTGPTLPRLAPFGIYRCADGWAAIVAPQDKLVADLFTVMGREDLLTDPRFAGRDARVRHEGELTRQVEQWTGERTTAEVVARLSAAGVPAAPVRTPQQAVTDERVTAREETLPVEHPALGQFAGLRTSGIPFRLAGARVGFAGPAPQLGEHTAQVLTEVAGYTPGQLAALQRSGVVGGEALLEP
jgi:crotonobetainyl-CoA:carnitine CoA-transferase CaiB-like acyl-CoA transferase